LRLKDHVTYTEPTFFYRCGEAETAAATDDGRDLETTGW
jgi:hypothetical protein